MLRGVEKEDNNRLTIPTRLRRLRRNAVIRQLVSETFLKKQDFVLPLFLVEGRGQKQPVFSMPGIYRYSLDLATKKIGSYIERGICSFALFPVVDMQKKSWEAEEAISEKALIPVALRVLKKQFPEACFIADVALDPFTSHGHDGIMNGSGEILNDVTVQMLEKMSCVYAAAGADMIAPSDMMDGRVLYIRKALDEAGFSHVSILSYSAKYASCFYTPFRYAIGSSVTLGDKKSYQLSPANKREALLEAKLDEEEHADILMVKPASCYLDVIQEIKKRSDRPIAAYHVSGEYAMVMAAFEKGLVSAKEAFFEILVSIKRAGADIIFSYAIDWILPLLEEK